MASRLPLNRSGAAIKPLELLGGWVIPEIAS